MASKRKAFLSRSVSLSLAALIVLTGAMFLITTLEQDHQEWKLVEDEVISSIEISSAGSSVSGDPVFVSTFDEETSTYVTDVTGGTKVSSRYQFMIIKFSDDFDFSKNYKFVISSNLKTHNFSFFDGSNYRNVFDLRNVVPADDSSYNASVILLDQLMVDLSFQSWCYFTFDELEASTDFLENSTSIQIFELHNDNAGSIAAAITGLTLIVMGVFATPMLNVFRRR